MKEISVVTLKITLDDVEPEVMRRVVVPFAIKMDRLHIVIQKAFGWTNTHLWEFRAANCGWGEPHEDYGLDGPMDARKATLLSVVRDAGVKTIRYIYDFGDCWDHTIKIERVRSAPNEMRFPFVLDATGACPPEDCGGAPGYADFLADPELRGNFDPQDAEMPRIEAALNELAEKWKPRPRKKRVTAKA